MSYASLVGLPDDEWRQTRPWSEPDMAPIEAKLPLAMWRMGDEPMAYEFDRDGRGCTALWQGWFTHTIDSGMEAYRDETGEVPYICRDACTCCATVRAALRSGAWTVAEVEDRL